MVEVGATETPQGESQELHTRRRGSQSPFTGSCSQGPWYPMPSFSPLPPAPQVPACSSGRWAGLSVWHRHECWAKPSLGSEDGALSCPSRPSEERRLGPPVDGPRAPQSPLPQGMPLPLPFSWGRGGVVARAEVSATGKVSAERAESRGRKGLLLPVGAKGTAPPPLGQPGPRKLTQLPGKVGGFGDRGSRGPSPPVLSH